MNALARKLRRQNFGCVSVFPRQKPRIEAHDGDLASEAAEGLRQLAADGPAPMTTSRLGRSVSEKTVSLVRKPASASPGIGRLAARAPVAMTAREKTQLLAVHLDDIWCDELRLAEKHVDTELGQSVRRIVI